jgi:hypothetical protein
VRAARAAEEQSLLLRDAAELRATTEIREALARYDAARERLGTFDAQLLAELAMFGHEAQPPVNSHLPLAERRRLAASEPVGEHGLCPEAEERLALRTKRASGPTSCGRTATIAAPLRPTPNSPNGSKVACCLLATTSRRPCQPHASLAAAVCTTPCLRPRGGGISTAGSGTRR